MRARLPARAVRKTFRRRKLPRAVPRKPIRSSKNPVKLCFICNVGYESATIAGKFKDFLQENRINYIQATHQSHRQLFFGDEGPHKHLEDPRTYLGKQDIVFYWLFPDAIEELREWAPKTTILVRGLSGKDFTKIKKGDFSPILKTIHAHFDIRK